MGYLDRAAALLDLAGNLHDATDVSGHDHPGACGHDMIHLALAEPLRHLGLRQVVGARGPAADFRLFERNELDAGYHLEQGPGLSTDLLAVAKVAGVVISHLERNRAARCDRPQ